MNRHSRHQAPPGVDEFVGCTVNISLDVAAAEGQTDRTQGLGLGDTQRQDDGGCGCSSFVAGGTG